MGAFWRRSIEEAWNGTALRAEKSTARREPAENTAPPASPPGGAGTPLPIKPGSGVQTTYQEIRQERKSPGANTGALIRRPSRLPGAPYTARERLTDAPSWLMLMVKGKACVRRSCVETRPACAFQGLPNCREPLTAAPSWRDEHPGRKSKSRASVTIVHDTPPGQIAPALPIQPGSAYATFPSWLRGIPKKKPSNTSTSIRYSVSLIPRPPGNLAPMIFHGLRPAA